MQFTALRINTTCITPQGNLCTSKSQSLISRKPEKSLPHQHPLLSFPCPWSMADAEQSSEARGHGQGLCAGTGLQEGGITWHPTFQAQKGVF